GDFGRGQSLGHGREAAHVDEHDRYLPRVPARGSQLVSKCAEMRIFPRRTDVDESKREREDAEEGDEAFFTALPRRQTTVDGPDDARAAQPPARRNEEFSHYRLITQAEDLLQLEAHRLLAAWRKVELSRAFELLQHSAPFGVLMHREEDVLQAAGHLRVEILANREGVARE